jgi:hypothetical protein
MHRAVPQMWATEALRGCSFGHELSVPCCRLSPIRWGQGRGERRVSGPKYLDLPGCSALLGLSVGHLRKLVKAGEFCEPAGRDGDPFWDRGSVLRWGASHSAALAARIPLPYWTAASHPADYLAPPVIPGHHAR